MDWGTFGPRPLGSGKDPVLTALHRLRRFAGLFTKWLQIPSQPRFSQARILRRGGESFPAAKS
jgi:hypothetical protein